MNGDFSRITFRPRRHHSSVRLQQGRVQVDADWNEQVDIDLHRDEVTTRDVVGPAGAPVGSDGFAIGMMTIPRRDPRARVPDGDRRARGRRRGHDPFHGGRWRDMDPPAIAGRPGREPAGGGLPVRDGRLRRRRRRDHPRHHRRRRDLDPPDSADGPDGRPAGGRLPVGLGWESPSAMTPRSCPRPTAARPGPARTLPPA